MVVRSISDYPIVYHPPFLLRKRSGTSVRKKLGFIEQKKEDGNGTQRNRERPEEAERILERGLNRRTRVAGGHAGGYGISTGVE